MPASPWCFLADIRQRSDRALRLLNPPCSLLIRPAFPPNAAVAASSSTGYDQGQRLRQEVEAMGRRVLEAQQNNAIQVTWHAQDCVVPEDVTRKKTRVYTGCDGVMVPVITEAEKVKRRDNIKAQRLRETDDLDGGGWFVTRRARIDHASLMRLLTQIAANGDIGLDIQHNDMLAMFHGLKRDERADIGVAGGINDDIDMGGAAQRFKVTGEGDLSSLNRGINGNAAVGFNNIGAPAPCHQHRVNGRFMPHFRNGPQPHPRHQ